MDWPEWLDKARPVEEATIEVGFVIRDSFYYGPENAILSKSALREPLYQPQVARYGGLVFTGALETSVEELVNYYADVLRLIRKHCKDLSRQSHYFWLRPMIFSTGGFAISFPWYDTWVDCACVLDNFEANSCGIVYSDIEQGWQLDVYADGDRLFLRQTDSDTGEEHCCVCCGRKQLTGQIAPLRVRAARILDHLRQTFGRDLWSRSW